MNQKHMDYITNDYLREYNHFDERDSAFERKLMEEDEEKLSLSIELFHLIGE